ncbi:unnamed protein product [Peniophora sp. CBMAI 1063]|nr:unnamed protein product [Peniophora sp. CBMAI 1063]
MSNQSYLGLPPVPADLKSITPYLQRADELKVQDPVVAYWCAYYAAQQGISLKALGPANRNFLSTLLTALENLRATIGPSDAINVESVAGVYVEDFALRVFNVADNEDRNGKANRSTAKKFLAAATFLEVMKVFEDKQLWESHADKARYAKWKAADIAKALREGRAPTAGPAGVDATTPPEIAPSQSFPHMISPAPSSSTVPTLPPPPPEMSSAAAAAQDDRYNAVRRAAESSQTLSTQAIAGDPRSTASSGVATSKPPPASISSSATLASGPLQTVGEEDGVVASGAPPSPPSSAGSGSSRRRRRAGSVVSPPSVSTGTNHTRNRTNSMGSVSSRSPARIGSPTHFVPRDSPPSTQLFIAANTPSVTQNVQGASATPASLGPSAPPSAISPSGLPLHASQSFPVPSAPPYYSAQSAPHYGYAPPPPPPAQPSPPPELTPSVIAKAQKHCRFAISALDYEDAEQARKELRSALALLGG